jgi:ribA/ribD-fused uncharacterized protein
MTIWNPNYYDNFTFFWCGKDGPFSQWEYSPFIVDGIKYTSAEQYMMYSKAILFGDTKIAFQIMITDLPKEQKALGRQVANFDEVKWNKVARYVVYRANYAKYSQNLDMLVKLFDTGDSLMVEASPYDKVWGIGLTAEQAALIPYKDWPGKNWLGEMLTRVCEDLLAKA